jgi:hypothetical protein
LDPAEAKQEAHQAWKSMDSSSLQGLYEIKLSMLTKVNTASCPNRALRTANFQAWIQERSFRINPSSLKKQEAILFPSVVCDLALYIVQI